MGWLQGNLVKICQPENKYNKKKIGNMRKI
jgi:hypothetical protein